MAHLQSEPHKTLVTGVSGFVAGHLAKALHESGIPTVGISRTAPLPGAVANGVPFLPLDLCDFAATLELLAREKFHTLYHLAATSFLQAAASEGGARSMLETNVRGTWNLLEAARQTGVSVIVVASSDKQYGALTVPPYDDDDSTAFANGGVYELSKAQQDQAARLYAGLYDSPAVRVARLVNVYGAGDCQWTRIIPGSVRRAIWGEAARITAGAAGAALREYIFVDNVVAALIALAEDAEKRGNAPLRRVDGKLAQVGFNIASGVCLPASEVIGTIRRILRDEFATPSPEPIVAPGTPGVFEPGSQFCKTERLRELLPDFVPLGFEEGLRRTIPWYLESLKASQGS